MFSLNFAQKNQKNVVLNYKSFGTGHPVLILHGLFGMLDNWQWIAKSLAIRYQVYIIDQRNHGKSPHSREFDYYAMVDDVLEFIDTQELESCYLIGHSMGGKAAMQFAVDNPDRVDKLVIADIAPKDYPRGHEHIFEALFGINTAQLESRKAAQKQLRQHLDNMAEIQFLLKNLKHKGKQGGYEWKFGLEPIYQNYEAIIQNSLSEFDTFGKPTLFVKGGNSPRYIEPSLDLAIIEQHFPQAILKILDEAGHWVHADQPEAFLQLVTDFF